MCKGYCHPLQVTTIVLETLLLLLGRAGAATLTAKSASLSDVVSEIRLARDGDTVVVPGGTVSWTSPLTITKGITLQGATSVSGDHTSGSITPTDRTVILDDVPRTPANNGGALIRVPSLTSTRTFRLTGFTFRYGSVTAIDGNGVIRINGTCPSTRIDHCHFDQLYGQGIAANGWLYGVVDHCVFDIRARGGAIVVHHDRWNNQTLGWGSWADSPHFGSEKFIFIEDNYLNNLGAAPSAGFSDATWGGRFVLRYNIINNASIYGHGTDAVGGNYRGQRAIEVYNNKYVATHRVDGGQLRGGTALYHHNTWPPLFGSSVHPSAYRRFSGPGGGGGTASHWGGADGSNPWDYNATETDGSHVDGHPPYTFCTGTVTSGSPASGVTTSLTISEAGWTPHRWAGYSVVNTNSGSAYYRGHQTIIDNTSDTLTLPPMAAGPPIPHFDPGDTIAIHKVLVILDQPGRGKSDLANRGSRPTWQHCALEPIYSWLNTIGGAQTDLDVGVANNLLANRDFYNQNASWTPGSAVTSGIAVGTSAQRTTGNRGGPIGCTPGTDVAGGSSTPGVGFWETDTNKLYVCTAPNTWTLYYTPYVYPHPLVSGMPASARNTAEDRRRRTDATSSSNK